MDGAVIRTIRGQPPSAPGRVLIRSILIGLTAFLTLVDLFATQAILPAIARQYGVTPAAAGIAVNSATLGMALAALGIAFFGRHIDRRRGIFASLALLTVPTAALAYAPDLAAFTVLRVAQGLCMAAAFSLSLSYLAEECSARDSAGAFAAYVTGNVASNLVGRLVAAAAVDHFGLEGNFLVFAALNLSGAVLVWCSLGRATAMPMPDGRRSPLSVWAEHLCNPALRASFAIGFLLLFAFIGTFTYVSFVLARPPFMLGQMALGLVYLVFAPSIFTTLLVGRLVTRFGPRDVLRGSLAVAGIGLPLLVVPSLSPVLLGLALIGVGTFAAQATATGFVGRVATIDRGAASGLYLASYFCGGLAGAALLGGIFDRFGWTACVAGIAAALALAAILSGRLLLPASQAGSVEAQ